MRNLYISLCAAAITLGVGATTAFAADNTVTVQLGNTFWNLSRTYGVSLQALEAANPTVDPNNLLVGTVLQLPATGSSNTVTTAATAATATTVTVQLGDTLWNIAHAHGVSLQALEAANPTANPNNLLVGTVLQLPVPTVSAPTASAPASASTSTTDTQQQNLYWMEHVINAEAEGESLQGQIAVGDVVLHRLQAGYGSTVQDVVFQVINGRYQFTCVANGYIYTDPTPGSIQAAMDVLNNGDDVVPGALVFYNPADTPATSWVRAQPILTQIGNLVFAK